MRKKIVAGNWKMNCTLQQGTELLIQLFKLLDIEESIAEARKKKLPVIVVAPSYIHLSDAVALSRAKGLRIAAQNCSSQQEGAYTGEVSASMLKSVGVKYVIVGHSERRKFYGETNAEIAQKINRALENDLSVICCIGETFKEREAGKELYVVAQQAEECLFHISASQFSKIVIAYEPVWAIGTGKNATPQQAQQMHRYIRSVIAGKYRKEIAEKVSILYGGSCSPVNASEIFSQPDVDGGLIGGASLNARDFTEVVKAAIV